MLVVWHSPLPLSDGRAMDNWLNNFRLSRTHPMVGVCLSVAGDDHRWPRLFPGTEKCACELVTSRQFGGIAVGSWRLAEKKPR
jgi:hypothetical protein